jgi:NarL family two-component system sensor histidine kinase LiaS
MSRLKTSLFALFRRLRWKLTLSYTAVTIGAMLVVELVVIVGVFAYFVSNARVTPEGVIQVLNTELVPIAQPYLSKSPPDTEGLKGFVQQFWGSQVDTAPLYITGGLELELKIYNFLTVIFVDSSGKLIGTIPRDATIDDGGEPLVLREVQGLEIPLRKALGGETEYSELHTVVEPENKIVGAIPIFDVEDTSKVVGALAFTTKSIPWGLLPIKEIGRQFGYSLVLITMVVGILGTLFGSLTARGLVQRLRKLSDSARGWSQGDFSIFVKDSSDDELGQLTNDLNSMAEQLEYLLTKRGELSAIEERNRLARDLHDSVKQQAFAASAQLGAAIAHMDENHGKAKEHLIEAEYLVYQVRQELTDLIKELHPATLRQVGLVSAIQEYADDWSKQNKIPIDVLVNGESSLPTDIEQNFYRIMQEALANVARHSLANKAVVTLHYDNEQVALSIEDDGIGFDVENVNTGMGLRSMRERAQMLNGCLQIDSIVGEGTRIKASCSI